MENIPKTQLACVCPSEGSKVIFRSNQPVKTDLKPDQVLVRLHYSGVCHTDLHVNRGDWPVHANFELIGGHEGAGEVVAIASHTTTPIKIGDRVGCKWLASSCLNCNMCRRGYEYCCSQATNHGFNVDGTFQQYVISDARHVTPIPEGLSYQEAAPIMCAGVTVYAALKKIMKHHVPGSKVVIPGAGGGLGHLAIQYAQLMGFSVIAIDTSKEKKDLVTQLGAEHWIDFAMTKDIVKMVQDVTGGVGADAALITAADPESYEKALDYLRPGGTLVCVGLPVNAKVEVDVFFTVFHEKRILGSYVGNRQDAVEAVELAARHKIKTIYKIKKLSELPQIFEDLHAGKIGGRIVLDCT